MNLETLQGIAATTRRAIAAADARLDWKVGDAATRELKKINQAIAEKSN